MNDIINYLTSHPLALGVAVVISLLIVLSFAKRILRFLLVLIALGILYIAWVSWNGGDPAEEAQKAGERVQETVEQGGEAMKAFDWLFKREEPPQNGE
ncbi:MAG TPA: hypothetical protein ENL07_04785 [Chlorobaculum parvum]|uniref:Uncharacterized protein n=1 Tax=Chlorobaculum parvum TaxID=274539 RepID=A0A7C5HEP7_9CHLB|nr:hypothetical protein [Chlorobaculum parvum]